MPRIYTIDYLRGILALCVVLYHYSGWVDVGGQDVSTLLGKLGIYAVSAFFIVSGMSIYLSYSNCNWNIRTIFGFGVRRFLRLAPTYWVALFFIICVKIASKGVGEYSFIDYFYNFTLLFGYLDISNYIVIGGWSIGVEVVFYLLFPFSVFLLKSNFGTFSLIIISLSLSLYFSVFIINKEMELSDMWHSYINPFNQLSLFVGGMLIAKYRVKLPKKYGFLGLMLACVIFYLYPVKGGWVEIITGYNRMLLIIIAIFVVFFVASIDYPPKDFFSKILNFLGDISYSIYLLHGVFFGILKEGAI